MAEHNKRPETVTVLDALRDLHAWVERYDTLPVMKSLADPLGVVADALNRAATETRVSPTDTSKRTPIAYEDATDDDFFLSTDDAANLMRSDRTTLANLRARGEGLPYYKPNGRVLYRPHDVMKAVNGNGRGWSRARLEAAIGKWPGRLTTAERKDLIAHIQAAMWK